MLEQDLMVFAGSASRSLAESICTRLDIGLGNAYVGRFPDGEINVKLMDHIRGADVFIIQSTCPPVNDHLMELLVMIDCFRRASAARITAVIPYFGYARQDRKDESRVPITAKLVANLITQAGAQRVLTVDLHAAQIQGFFDIPVDHLYSKPIFIKFYKDQRIDNLVVVTPDVGSIRMARSYAGRLNAPLAIVDKRRIAADQAEAGNVIGDVSGKNVLICDDMISTAGSLVAAVEILLKHGAQDIHIAATHPVLSGSAYERLESSSIRQITVSDTIPIKDNLSGKIRVLSIAPLLASAIGRIHSNKSVSTLFV